MGPMESQIRIRITNLIRTYSGFGGTIVTVYDASSRGGTE